MLRCVRIEGRGDRSGLGWTRRLGAELGRDSGEIGILQTVSSIAAVVEPSREKEKKKAKSKAKIKSTDRFGPILLADVRHLGPIRLVIGPHRRHDLDILFLLFDEHAVELSASKVE